LGKNFLGKIFIFSGKKEVLYFEVSDAYFYRLGVPLRLIRGGGGNAHQQYNRRVIYTAFWTAFPDWIR
jgi:hypothetical protein